jgi:hypothetical protein
VLTAPYGRGSDTLQRVLSRDRQGSVACPIHRSGLEGKVDMMAKLENAISTRPAVASFVASYP